MAIREIIEAENLNTQQKMDRIAAAIQGNQERLPPPAAQPPAQPPNRRRPGRRY